jgi:hypothetical protein
MSRVKDIATSLERLTTADAKVLLDGSVAVIFPVSEAGKFWLANNVQEADAPKWGGGTVVERNYLPAVLEGMKEDGLLIEPV